MLALAHWIERQVEAGVIKDYAAAARVIGVSRARLSQIMGLLTLPVKVQEAVLTGKVVVSEKQLRNLQMPRVLKNTP